ncbi:MAG: hypothetical protein WA945_10220 [Arcobacteraceae bacterium]
MNVSSNIEAIAKGLNDFEKKQLPFMISKAMNDTSKIASTYMKEKIDKDFGITSSWNKVGGKFGVKTKRSTKKNLVVEIYIPTTNTWIQDHEDGDDRTKQLIPTNYFKMMFPNLRTNRSIKKKAATLLSDKSKNRLFEAPILKNNNTMAIFQRVKGKVPGKRRLRSTKSGRLLKAKKVLKREAVPLFIIKARVKENPILEFETTILKQFQMNFDKQFSKAYHYAMEV